MALLPVVDQELPDTAPPSLSLPGSPHEDKEIQYHSLVNASHISTREVLEEGDKVKMVVRRQKVSIRKADNFLNASEILRPGTDKKLIRDYYLKKLREVSNKQGLDVWAPFPDGVFLCYELHLDQRLQPLLDIGPPPPECHENYLSDQFIPFNASKGMINATRLVQKHGIAHSIYVLHWFEAVFNTWPDHQDAPYPSTAAGSSKANTQTFDRRISGARD